MGSNANRVTNERCLEAYNLATDKDNYDLIEIIQKEMGNTEKRIRFYLVVRCKTCGNIFESEFYNWSSGKRCKKCACKTINSERAYKTEDAIEIATSRGYKYIEGECVNNRSRIIVEDANGYRYNPKLNDIIRRNGNLSPFKTTNPFTIYNIKKYCENNGTKTILLDDVYISNSTKMKWECEKCKEVFERDWAKFSSYNAFVCKKCSEKNHANKQKKPIEDIRKIFEDKGLVPLFDKCDNNEQKLKCMYADGYVGYINYAALQDGNMPRKFGKENIYTNDNIRKYCLDKGISTTLIDEYNGSSEDMSWVCGVCGDRYMASWASFYGKGYHYCAKCSDRREITKEPERLDFNKVKSILDERECTILSKKIPITVKDKIVYRDSEGYLYHTLCSTILRGCDSSFVHPQNPYSIRNIRKFINNNKIDVSLVSNEYNTSGDYSIELLCNCGNLFKTSWANLQTRLTSKCIECRKKDTLDLIRRVDWKQVVEEETNFEYKLIKIKYPQNAKGEVRIVVKHNECGRIYEVGGYSFKSGAKCRPCAVVKAGIERRETIEEFKKYVRDVTNGEYECLSDEYNVANTPLRMRHNLCRHEYMVSPSSFKNGGEHNNGTRCPKCANLRSVSYTHAILSLLFDKYFCGVEFEYDAGFRTKKNGVSKYDLYVEPLNLLIEWQSEYHDSHKQKQIDRDKELYAKNNGYEFLALDHRTFRTIDYVKMFFPFLNEIPQDLNLEMFNKFDVTKAQTLLNSGLTIKESAKIMNEKTSKLYGSIKRGDLQYPEGYFIVNKQNKEVVQLSLDGEFIREYTSLAEAKRITGFKSISLACSGKMLHSGGYVWVYKDKYESGDYTVPKKEDCTIYGKPIVQLTLDGEKVGVYSSQKDAGDKTNIKASSISAGMRSGKGYCGGYVWVYLDDYNKGSYIMPKKRRVDFKVVQLTLNDQFVCEYDNITDVANKCGYRSSNISKAMSSGRTSNGFKWMYKNDYDKMISEKMN